MCKTGFRLASEATGKIVRHLLEPRAETDVHSSGMAGQGGKRADLGYISDTDQLGWYFIWQVLLYKDPDSLPRPSHRCLSLQHRLRFAALRL